MCSLGMDEPPNLFVNSPRLCAGYDLAQYSTGIYKTDFFGSAVKRIVAIVAEDKIASFGYCRFKNTGGTIVSVFRRLCPFSNVLPAFVQQSRIGLVHKNAVHIDLTLKVIDAYGLTFGCDDTLDQRLVET